MPDKYKSRRPYKDNEPNGYMESDRDYINNNLNLAVSLLDEHGAYVASLFNISPDKPLWQCLTFSGLTRYVMICDVVMNSDQYLAQDDRINLIQELLAYTGPLNAAGIENRCVELADKNLEYNMARARTVLEGGL